MPIPESQLVTWSKQGSITQSADTYASIKNILQDQSAPYALRSCDIFLQGSYGNDTNIWADSDVDIVKAAHSIYYSDISNLKPDEIAAFNASRIDGGYSFNDFRNQVMTHLTSKLGSAVHPGNKAIFIKGNGVRRDADVVPAIEYRTYLSYSSFNTNDYVEGIVFWTRDGTEIINYPKLHSANYTKKHQATNGWLKPTVRILKNMRNSMMLKGYLTDDVAPSYFLEGMLYNVPNNLFGWTYSDTVKNALTWISSCDRTKLVCANEIYSLLHPTSPVTWRAEKLNTYLNAALLYWRRWPN